MPLTIARPSPAPRPTAGSRIRRTRRAALPGHVEDPVHVLARDAAARVGDAELDRVAHLPAGDLDDPVGGRVPDRVDEQVGHHPRQLAGVGGDEEAVVHVSAEAYAAGAGDRVGAGQRLADHVAQRDRLEVQRQHAGVDAGELEEVVDHPHHPVDLGADLAVVAGGVVGQPVLERLGHRAHRGQRRAQVVGHPRDQLAPRLLEPLLAERATPAAACAVTASSSLSSWSSTGPREPASNRPLSPKRRASSRMVRDQRANAVPTTNETPIATTPATVTTQSTTSRSWSERNIARAVPTTPATTASTAVSATTPTCQRNDAVPHDPRDDQAQQAGRARPGGADPDDRPLVVRHRASHR